MGLLNAIGRAFTAALDIGAAGASVAIQTAKKVAAEAISWLADKSEKFVDDVKETWPKVKPYIQKAHVAIKAFANTIQVPWVKAVLLSVDKVLDALFALENSPVLQHLEKAIRYVAKLARMWRARAESAAEAAAEAFDVAEARQHQSAFRQAESDLKNSTVARPVSVLAAINDLEIAKHDLTKAIETPPADFEHFLRIRATQKLIGFSEQRFRQAETVDDLDQDDLLVLKIASGLIQPEPALSNEAAARLDAFLQRRHATRLMPFIYSELVVNWELTRADVEAQWERLNTGHAKDAVLYKRLKIALDIQGELDAEEAALLAQLETSVPATHQKLEALGTHSRDLEQLVGAAEGFLQFLEKDEEQIRKDDQAYLLESGPEVGRLLIKCAEQNLPISALSEAEQASITAFANIFRAAAQKRMESAVQVPA